MARSMKKGRLIGVVSLTLAGLAVSAWHHANGESVAPKAVAAKAEASLVRALRVEPTALDEVRAAIGEIRPQRESDLGFRLSGKIVKRLVDTGAMVRKGDLLATIEDEDYRNKVRNAKTEVATAEAVLVEAAANEKRQGGLFKKRYTSAVNYEASVKAFRSAEAKLESAKIALQMAKDQLGYTELRADFDGIVTSTGAENGQLVNVGQMVVRVADPKALDAVFSIAESVFANSPEGQIPPISVALLSNPAIKVTGRVREISPVADAVTRTFQIKVGLDNPPAEMRFGASVAGRLDRKAEPMVVLPGGALFDKGGEPAVWVVGQNSEVSLKPVTVVRYEIDRVVIGRGLNKGDIVVTAGVNRLHDRQKVRLQEGISE